MTEALIYQSKEYYSDILLTKNHLKICEINTFSKFSVCLNVLIKIEENIKKSGINTLFQPKNRYFVPQETVNFLYPNLTSIEIIKKKNQVYIQLKKHG